MPPGPPTTEFSGRVQPGWTFAALPGVARHGLAFLPEALARGAAAVLTDRPLPGCRVPVQVADDARAEFGRRCSAWHGDPSAGLPVVGVTGTNGKTTTAWLTRSIFAAGGGPAGLCGTLGRDAGTGLTPQRHTTPPTEDLHAWLAECVAGGCRAAAVELSSHALAQDRPAGLRLAAAVVTNVTRDHLDYHHTEEAVRRAKAKIARHVSPGGPLLVNADDAGPRAVAGLAGVKPLWFSLKDPHAPVRATDIACGPAGSTFTLHLPGEVPVRAAVPLPGRFNVENALAAAGAAWACGVDREQIAAGLADAPQVPGRMERVEAGQPVPVLVDYAHTPDSLRRVILTADRLFGPVTLVVGAGGDRDPGKRAGMGEAAHLAHFTIFTADNPRSERVTDICRDLEAGHGDVSTRRIIPDRREAIRLALARVHEDGRGCVLVCGKGHEATQEIRGTFHPFDDRVVCREELRALCYRD